MKCPNCGKTDFRAANLFDTCILEGYQKELFQAYACINCGRIEMYMPKDWGAKILAAEKEAEEKRKREEARLSEEKRLREQITELEKFIQDETHSVKEWRDAQKELSEIREKLAELTGKKRGPFV